MLFGYDNCRPTAMEIKQCPSTHFRAVDAGFDYGTWDGGVWGQA